MSVTVFAVFASIALPAHRSPCRQRRLIKPGLRVADAVALAVQAIWQSNAFPLTIVEIRQEILN